MDEKAGGVGCGSAGWQKTDTSLTYEREMYLDELEDGLVKHGADDAFDGWRPQKRFRGLGISCDSVEGFEQP